MHCVSCGASLLDDDRYCSACGAYQPETRRIHKNHFSEPTAPQPSPPRRKFLRGIFKKSPTYHCETMQAFDRFAERTHVTLTLDADAERLLIAKGATRVTLPYEQILDFSVSRSQKQDRTLFDVLQSVIGMNHRWIATLTYQTQASQPVKRLRFVELDDDVYYDDDEMSGRAKRFEKAVDQIVRRYHPIGELN